MSESARSKPLDSFDVELLCNRAFAGESSVAVAFNGLGLTSSPLLTGGDTVAAGEGIKQLLASVAAMQRACTEKGVHATVRMSCLELRGRRFRDLLVGPAPEPGTPTAQAPTHVRPATASSTTQISIRDSDMSKQPYISGAIEASVSSEADMLECLQYGLANMCAAGDPSCSPTVASRDTTSCQVPDKQSEQAGHVDATSEGATAQPTLQSERQRSQDSHIMLTIHILLQGPKSSMPIASSSASGAAKSPPHPPPLPGAFATSKATKKASGSDLQRLPSQTGGDTAAPPPPPPPQDEWILKSTIRLFDVTVPQTPEPASTPTAEQQHTSGLSSSKTLVAAQVIDAGATPRVLDEGTPMPTHAAAYTSKPPSLLGHSSSISSRHSECTSSPAASPRVRQQRPTSTDTAPEAEVPLRCNTPPQSAMSSLHHHSLLGQRSPSGLSQSPSMSEAPHHVALQTSSRRLRPMLPTPVKVASIATGGEPRGDVLQAAQAAGLVPASMSVFTGSGEGASGVEALERALDSSTHGSALVKYRQHPLTRLLRSALLGTCHRIVIPLPEPIGTATVAYLRALALIERMNSLPQLKPMPDAAAVDTQSDVVKWMRYENRSLRSELKVARDKIALLQKYLESRGAHEVKTWDLWRNLQEEKDAASELRGEIGGLEVALGTARGAAAAASAAAEAADARAAAEAARSAGARREAASAAARAEAMEAAVDRMARQLADVASAGALPEGAGELLDGANKPSESTGTEDACVQTSASLSSSPRLRSWLSRTASRKAPGFRSDSWERLVCVHLHVVRSQVAVRIRPAVSELRRGGSGGAERPRASAEVEASAPPALQLLQEELAARVSAAEQRHRQRSTHARRTTLAHDDKPSPLPATLLATADPGSVTHTAMSIVSLLARALLPSSGREQGQGATLSRSATPAETSQAVQDPHLGLQLHARVNGARIAAGGPHEGSTDLSSVSDRGHFMPRTPSAAAHAPPSPRVALHSQSQQLSCHVKGVQVGTASSHHQSGGAEPSAQPPTSPLSSQHHTAASVAPLRLDRLPWSQADAACTGSAAGSAVHGGAAATQASPHRVASTDLHSPGAYSLASNASCGSATSGMLSEAGIGERPSGRQHRATVWPTDVGTTPAEWMAALAMLPRLPELLQRWLEGTVHSPGGASDIEQQVQLVKQELEQAKGVAAVVFPPFEAPQSRVLHMLWGWLLPWCTATAPEQLGRHSHSEATAADAETTAVVHATHARTDVGRSEDHMSDGGASCQHVAGGDCGDASTETHDHVNGTADTVPSVRSKNSIAMEERSKWKPLAMLLHEMVAGVSRGHQHMALEEREEHSSEIQMLTEALQVHQACLDEHVSIHASMAGKLAELEKVREDAEARAQVFDETVSNLVRAKMAHATADITLRSMRDQIEALSAQVPLSNGVGTNSGGPGQGAASWRTRAQARATRWRNAAEPGVAAAVSRSAAVARSAISGLSSYFGGRSNSDRENAPHP